MPFGKFKKGKPTGFDFETSNDLNILMNLEGQILVTWDGCSV